jgi:lysophospholipase L1-like esterase
MRQMVGVEWNATGVMWTHAVGQPSRPARLMLAGLLGLCGVLGLAVVAAPALPIEYFALGDSVASGHGLADDETACRQSPHAYPWRVLEHLQAAFDVQRFELLACSGTTTATLDRQVSEILGLLSERPTLITLTVGANDFGWPDLFPFARHLCARDEDTFHDWVNGITRTIEDNLVVQLGRLSVYPNAEVILTDYYNPTNTSGAFWELVNPRCLFVNVYQRTESLVHTLNASLTVAWQRLGSPSAVHVATAHAAFHGHEAPHPSCGTAPPAVEDTWIQYPGDPDSNATPVGGECFHPNRRGAAAYAESVLAVVPEDLALPLRLSVNDSSVQRGETLTLTVTMAPEPTLRVVDLYVSLQAPDQSLWFLQADGGLSPEVLPLAGGWTVAPFRGEVFRYTFAGAEPPGGYRWLAAFTEPGTWMIVGGIAQAPFTFHP